MSLFLGLDGGGTGCRAILTDAEGRVMGRAEGGPANVMSDPEGAVSQVTACALAALAGHDPAQVTAVLGLAGVNTSGAAEWLPQRLPFGRVRVVQDAVTAAAGALGAQDGIVAAMGTGSVFIRQTAGEVVTIGGWGPILGDEGSGNWLGRRFLAHVLRASDGLAAETPLTHATIARHGGRSGIVSFARSAAAADFAAEARQIQSDPQDPAAQHLLAEAAQAVAQSIAALQPRTPLPVVFTGGLGPVYSGLLRDRWELREPLGTPLDGALRLAREV
ncbi:BadF/BadG/BcrA/BcrD ATPase family protein [Paracoccus xiamenensis]|uniref:BadF/BadG/BcrA/BcrD ATPase family protein n=1 Tax=Paracoccus xiamenensis TaxID=2714901 RepID=UPI0014086097|nr:BadF/BadG/BcrA/BcrD ATPase family protein [Paracoccus xiamenensis]NHF74691.1 ATPase [Paracoccus xiamenensis]